MPTIGDRNHARSLRRTPPIQEAVFPDNARLNLNITWRGGLGGLTGAKIDTDFHGDERSRDEQLISGCNEAARSLNR
jgi:hypothetical protein